MSAAGWIHVLLLSVLWCHTCDGQCFKEEHRAVCKSPNQAELFRFFENECRGTSSLTIEDLPLLRKELYTSGECRMSVLAIKNSKIGNLLGPIKVIGTLALELTHNNITKLDAYIPPTSESLLKLVMSHNLIENLDGNYLEGFPNLQKLDLSHNRIRNVTRLYRNYLRFVNLSSNMLEGIGNVFERSQELRVIDLSANKLKSISADIFGDLYYLKYLNLRRNEIHTVKYNSPKLNYDYGEPATVDLSRNRLKNSDVLFLSVVILDENEFENLKVLKYRNENLNGRSLIFRRCGIKKLSSRNFDGLKLNKLDLAFNSIEMIPPFAFDRLQVGNLSVDHNRIEYLNELSFAGVTGLERLNLSFNPLKTVGELVFANLTLKELDLSHCQLSKVPDLPSGKFLRRIHLSHNLIRSIEPGTFSNLDFLDLSHNEIDKIQENAFSGKNIKVFNLSSNKLKTFGNVFNGSFIGNAVLDNLSLSILSADDMEGLNSSSFLSIQNSGIKEFSGNVFSRSESLFSLSLDGNSIRSVPSNLFLSAKRLQSLSISRNPLETLSSEAFHQKNRMMRFNLTINGKIRERNFGNLAGLKELGFFDSNITELQEGSFEDLENLKELVFTNTTISEIRPGAFSGLSSLTRLNLSSMFNMTVLKSRTFVGLKNLETLDLSDNLLEKIETEAFAGLRELVSLNITRNRIKALSFGSFRGLRFLKTLDLSRNRLNFDVDKIGVFIDLPELTHLDLGGNGISQIATGVFTGLRNLKCLNLTGNRLEFLEEYEFYSLRRLETLDLNRNSLRGDSWNWLFENSLSLKTVGIGVNSLTCYETLRLLKIFDKKSIDYTKISIAEFQQSNIEGIGCT